MNMSCKYRGVGRWENHWTWWLIIQPTFKYGRGTCPSLEPKSITLDLLKNHCACELNHVESCWIMLNHVESCWIMLNHVELNPWSSELDFFLAVILFPGSFAYVTPREAHLFFCLICSRQLWLQLRSWAQTRSGSGRFFSGNMWGNATNRWINGWIFHLQMDFPCPQIGWFISWKTPSIQGWWLGGTPMT